MNSDGPREAAANGIAPFSTLIGELELHAEGERVAVLRFTEEDDALSLDLVRVASAHRGRGLGSQLIARLLVLADAAGKTVKTLARPIGSNSPETLARLERYYSRLGFEIVERGVSSTRMVRPLQSAEPNRRERRAPAPNGSKTRGKLPPGL